ncbi:MAG: NAD(P)/FAD-dependent oxidoreductase [Deltaproteobacteria bacterium]|nr:NAD(P)/FAD-dependent oxidoreductase [Deltaproteobacteria bacterium]
MSKVVIVGAGMAGFSAALQLRRLGIEFILLDKKGEPGGLIPNAWRIENYIGFEGTGFELQDRMREKSIKYGIEVLKRKVTDVFFADERINLVTDDGNFSTEYAVLAPGTENRKLPSLWPGEDILNGVTTLKDKSGKKIGVIGGGEAGCDHALFLADRNCEVEIFLRGSNPKCSGDLYNNVKSRKNIRFVENFIPSKIFVSENKKYIVSGYSGCDNFQKEFDFLINATGRVSRLAMFDIIPSTGVVTERQGLYVAGDARLGSLGQLGIAAGDGLECAIKIFGDIIKCR